MSKKPVTAKISEETKEDLEDYADEKGISRSEAISRLVRQSLKIENGDVEIVPVSPDGSGVRDTVEQNQEKVDGLENEVRESRAEVEQVQQQVESQSTNQNLNYLFMFIGLLYIAASLQYDLPSVTIGIGVIALIGIVATNYRDYVKNV